MTLVFLPGFMCDARLFGPQLAAFPDSLVVTTTTKDTMTGMANDVLAHAPDKFALAGLSMGGIVAMEIMRLAPGRVTRLALLDTNHRAETADIKAARMPLIEAVQSGNLGGVLRDQVIPQYLTDGQENHSISDLCVAMGQDLGAAAFVNQSRALMDRCDQTETLKAIDCPALILCGAQDRLCPVARHQDMARLIPQATLKIIEHAGHLPTLEEPAATTAALNRWLQAS